MNEHIKNLLIAALSHRHFRDCELRADGGIYFRDLRIPDAIVKEMGPALSCVDLGEVAA